MKKQILALVIIFGLFPILNVSAQAPQGYYDLADQKKGSALKNAFHKVIRSHINLDYDINASYWWYNYFRKTDWHQQGYFWDMYSSYQRPDYNGSVQNREHLMPRSWWGTSSTYPQFDANGDLHNLYPSDQPANSAKSNYPLGEVGTASFQNGVVKVGNNTYPSGYRGTVFEPADEYKGDFARVYFYMVTCYEDYASIWRSIGINSVLQNEYYPVLQEWSIQMLLKWHENDPVSQKEIDRNNEVFGIQQNRNPFIDFPDLVQYVWGNKVDQLFTIENKAEDPVLITPTNEISVDFGEVLIGTPAVKSIPVRGKGLTGYMSARLFNNMDKYYSIPTTSIPTSSINSDSGYDLKITYLSRIEGQHSASLMLYDGGFEGSVNVNITAKCVSTLTGIDDNLTDLPRVFAANGKIYLENIPERSHVQVYSVSGQKILDFYLEQNEVFIDKRGIYLVKIENKLYKVVL